MSVSCSISGKDKKSRFGQNDGVLIKKCVDLRHHRNVRHTGHFWITWCPVIDMLLFVV